MCSCTTYSAASLIGPASNRYGRRKSDRWWIRGYGTILRSQECRLISCMKRSRNKRWSQLWCACFSHGSCSFDKRSQLPDVSHQSRLSQCRSIANCTQDHEWYGDYRGRSPKQNDYDRRYPKVGAIRGETKVNETESTPLMFCIVIQQHCRAIDCSSFLQLTLPMQYYYLRNHQRDIGNDSVPS